MSPFTSLELQSWLIKIDVMIFNLLIGKTMFNLMFLKLSYYSLKKSYYKWRELSVRTKQSNLESIVRSLNNQSLVTTSKYRVS